jgi:hypothetical protein
MENSSETLICEKCDKLIEVTKDSVCCDMCKRCLKLICSSCCKMYVEPGGNCPVSYCYGCFPFTGETGSKKGEVEALEIWHKTVETATQDYTTRLKIMIALNHIAPYRSVLDEGRSIDSFVDFYNYCVEDNSTFNSLPAFSRKTVARKIREEAQSKGSDNWFLRLTSRVD